VVIHRRDGSILLPSCVGDDVAGIRDEASLVAVLVHQTIEELPAALNEDHDKDGDEDGAKDEWPEREVGASSHKSEL
jgi:hypothetical protein